MKRHTLFQWQRINEKYHYGSKHYCNLDSQYYSVSEQGSVVNTMINILHTELAQTRKMQLASSKNFEILCYKEKRCLLCVWREQDPSFLCYEYFAYTWYFELLDLYKIITTTRPQNTSVLISADAECFLELFQAIKISCVSLFAKVPFGGSLQASWKSTDLYQLGNSENQVNNGNTG